MSSLIASSPGVTVLPYSHADHLSSLSDLIAHYLNTAGDDLACRLRSAELSLAIGATIAGLEASMFDAHLSGLIVMQGYRRSSSSNYQETAPWFVDKDKGMRLTELLVTLAPGAFLVRGTDNPTRQDCNLLSCPTFQFCSCISSRRTSPARVCANESPSLSHRFVDAFVGSHLTARRSS